MMDDVSLSAEATLERFNRTQDRVARDMGLGDTAGAIGITKDALVPFKDYIQDRIKLPPHSLDGEERRLLHVIGKLDPEIIALATLNGALHSVAMEQTWTETVTAIGETIKSEAWAAGLLMHDPELRNRIERAAKRRHGKLNYRRQAARSIAAAAGYKGDRWSMKLVITAGTILARYLLNALPDMFVIEEERSGERTKQWLTITPSALARAEQTVEAVMRRNSVFLPMTSPPKPWTGYYTGGHWDEHSRFKAPVVRTKYKESIGAIRAAMASGDMQGHVDALNALQAVPWTINERVLGVLRWAWQNDIQIKGNKPGSYAFPPANDELPPPKTGDWATMTDDQKKAWRHQAAMVKQRNRGYVGARLLMKRDVETAERMAEAGRFWTPVNSDWRGRIYALPHFNFARDDRVRALFLFADGEPLGEEGLYWLQVQVANSGDFGKSSKKPLDERVCWTKENLQRIRDMVEIPTKDLWWTEADKPFLFLAACFELVSALATSEPHLYQSRLPVSFDGSCSGLQHLSAMTRDEQTARLVNLLPSEKPADIYQTIAEAVSARMTADVSVASVSTIAELWLRYGVTRKVVKRNVMTYAYSSKKFGMAQQIMDDLMEPLNFEVLEGKRDAHPFAHPSDGKRSPGHAAAKYLASIVFDTIERLVHKPAQAMKFLQKTARALAHEGKPVRWATPLGLPWENRYHVWKTKRLNLWLHDVRITTRFAEGEHEPEIRKDKAANSVAPNFVHACDAAHLLMVANASAAEGIQMATVHDSFGCLASRAGRYRDIIREQFIRLYSNHNVLCEVRSQASFDLTVHNQQRLPHAPNFGALNLKEVLLAEYAFA